MTDESFVRFTASGMEVDLERWLRTPAGVALLGSFAQKDRTVRMVNAADAQRREMIALRREAATLRAVLVEGVERYGQPGGPWNVPSDPGGWLYRAKVALGWVAPE